MNAVLPEMTASNDDDLGIEILHVFRRACSDQRFDDADHLLRALEALDGAEVDKDRRRTGCATAAAYRVLAGMPEA